MMHPAQSIFLRYPNMSVGLMLIFISIFLNAPEAVYCSNDGGRTRDQQRPENRGILGVLRAPLEVAGIKNLLFERQQRKGGDLTSQQLQSLVSITANIPNDAHLVDSPLSASLDAINSDAETFGSVKKQDALLERLYGPIGALHIFGGRQKRARVLPKKGLSDDPRLEYLNLQLSLHGYPPLPYIPSFLIDAENLYRARADPTDEYIAFANEFPPNASEFRRLEIHPGTQEFYHFNDYDVFSVEQLIEAISSGLPVPRSVISSFPEEKYSNERQSWMLPSTKMPDLNPGLAKSPWPITHRNGYAQASSSLPGPDGSRRLVHDILNRALITSNPITLFYTADHKYLWGSSWTSIFKVERDTRGLYIVDYIQKNTEKILADKFHGAYALLTEEGVFVVASAQQLEGYYDKTGKGGKQIQQHPEVFDLREAFKNETTFPVGKEEVIRAMCMSHDGHIVWVSDTGRVGVIDRHVKNGGFNAIKDWLMLGTKRSYKNRADNQEYRNGEQERIPLEVSNNIACDEYGGIYVVSSQFMHRVNWDGKHLSMGWEQRYDEDQVSTETASVRLGAGSGSTPTLMGSGNNTYVVITDSARLMNITVMNAKTGTIEAKKAITFGNPNAAETSSEQSVLVHGWRMVVVNNEPTKEAKRHSDLFKLLGSPAKVFPTHANKGALTRVAATLKNALPVIVGDAPRGVEQFEFDPINKRIRTVWATDISIPNGIPCMSARTQMIYGIGKRGEFGRGGAAPLRGVWTLEALDWWTGRSAFFYNLGAGPWSNSIYAATQVGPNEVITGTAAGIVRIKEA